MKFLNESVTRASKHVVKELLKDGGNGLGSVIAVDARGNGRKFEQESQVLILMIS